MSTAGLKKPEPINTSLPSVRLLQSYIRHKQPVEVKIMTGEAFSGILSWLDGNGICLKVDDRPFLIWYAAISYVKPIGDPQA
mgnify:CR=1 FL=1|jgi:host factor-I protein